MSETNFLRPLEQTGDEAQRADAPPRSATDANGAALFERLGVGGMAHPPPTSCPASCGEGVSDAAAVSGVGDVGQDIKEGKGRRQGKTSGCGLGFSPLPAIRVPAKINY